MQFKAEVLHAAVIARQDNGSVVIGDLTLRFRINSNEIEVLPNFLHQLVEVPLISSGDRHVVGHFRDEVQLLDGNLINLVHHVDAGHVNAISLNHIN